MKKLVLVLAFAGCAALNGQTPYDGPTDNTPVMGFESRMTPDPCGPNGQNRCTTNHGFGYVTNPSFFPIKVTIDCDDLFTLYPDVVIPARTTQQFMVDRTATRCWLRERETLAP